MDGTALKTDRVLKIHSRPANGEVLRKKELAQQFHVTERSVQRDMESLRCFFAEQGLGQEHTDRSREGEFRKRVQFMCGGRLEKIRFKYTGPSIEAVQERLPAAEIISPGKEGRLVEAEVFGKEIEMWIRSQENHITRQEA